MTLIHRDILKEISIDRNTNKEFLWTCQTRDSLRIWLRNNLKKSAVRGSNDLVLSTLLLHKMLILTRKRQNKIQTLLSQSSNQPNLQQRKVRNAAYTGQNATSVMISVNIITLPNSASSSLNVLLAISVFTSILRSPANLGILAHGWIAPTSTVATGRTCSWWTLSLWWQLGLQVLARVASVCRDRSSTQQCSWTLAALQVRQGHPPLGNLPSSKVSNNNRSQMFHKHNSRKRLKNKKNEVLNMPIIIVIGWFIAVLSLNEAWKGFKYLI